MRKLLILLIIHSSIFLILAQGNPERIPSGQPATSPEYVFPPDFNPFLDSHPCCESIDDIFYRIAQDHPNFAGFIYDVKTGYSTPKIFVKGEDVGVDPMLSVEERMALEASIRTNLGNDVFLPQRQYVSISQMQSPEQDPFFFTEAVEYETTRYSFLELRGWLRKLIESGLMGGRVSVVNFVDLDEGNNYIGLGIDGQDPLAEEQIMEIAFENNIPEDAINISLKIYR